MSAAERMSRKRAGTSVGELDTERRENTASRRIARARRTSMDRAVERRDNTISRRAARRMSTVRTVEQSENTASRRAARARQPSSVRAALRIEDKQRRRVARDRTISARRQAGASRSVWNELPVPNSKPRPHYSGVRARLL